MVTSGITTERNASRSKQEGKTQDEDEHERQVLSHGLVEVDRPGGRPGHIGMSPGDATDGVRG